MAIYIEVNGTVLDQMFLLQDGYGDHTVDFLDGISDTELSQLLYFAQNVIIDGREEDE